MTDTWDVIVVGAGMAGLSAAAELAKTRRALVLERESAPAQHTTGRSAALYINTYGGPAIRPLSVASLAWFESDAEGFAEQPLLSPRGYVGVARPGDEHLLDGSHSIGGEPISVAEAVELLPVLRGELVAGARYKPDVTDIDVAECVAALRRALRSRQGAIETSAPVLELRRTAGSWLVSAGDREWSAPLLVNAAGAWADQVAAAAGLEPLGLTPLRRTIATFNAPAGLAHEHWPVLQDVGDRFYLKPQVGSFMVSPIDETPSEPCDARPEEIDVARALDAVAEATTLQPRSITSAWAGLRTFAPDRSLVLGPDPREPGFAWCAGHGGFGIQAGAGAAQALVALIDGGWLPEAVAALGATPGMLLPDRLIAGASGAAGPAATAG